MRLAYDETNITSIDIQGENEDLSIVKELVEGLGCTIEDTDTGFVIKGFQDHSEGEKILRAVVKSIWMLSQLSKLNKEAELKTIEELIKEI